MYRYEYNRLILRMRNKSGRKKIQQKGKFFLFNLQEKKLTELVDSSLIEDNGAALWIAE